MKKFLKLINYIIFIAIISTFIYFLLNYKIYIVATGSMQPTFKINELIVVKNSNTKTVYSVGDIITYYDGELKTTVTHRITDILNNQFYTKGDYNNARDLKPVNTENVVGKVIYNSYFLGTLYTNYRFHIAIILIIAIITLNFLFEGSGKFEKNNK